MTQVLNPEDFAAARAVRSARLKELGFVPVCMAPGAANPGHSHTLVEEILIVRSGTGQIQIEDDVHELRPGSVAVVPAGKFHAVCNTGSQDLEGVTIFNKNVDTDAVVLKSRKQHFKKQATAQQAMLNEVEKLKKQNKKLKKALKKAKKKG